jgi:sulfatase modifying factor 1
MKSRYLKEFRLELLSLKRMMKLFLLLSLSAISLLVACKQKENSKDPNFVLVEGGAFTNTQSNLYGKGNLPNFCMGKNEVTQKEWVAVMGSNPSKFRGDNLPVETVSWYDCIEYCNKRSIKEGLKPYYIIDKNKKDPINKSEFDSLKFTVTVNKDANGYRLPTEAEWEYAAGGGQKSKSYKYSGSNDIDEVAWYWKNSGDKILTGTWNWAELEKNRCQTKAVGSKKANELGLYDMSGNVREWCEDWYQDDETPPGIKRTQRGGGWIGSETRCESSNRHSFEANGKGADQGLRLCKGI